MIDPGIRACENCATPDDELVLVRRVYLVPEAWDSPEARTVVPEPELWCISCCSQFPCELADGEDGEAPE